MNKPRAEGEYETKKRARNGTEITGARFASGNLPFEQIQVHSVHPAKAAIAAVRPNRRDAARHLLREAFALRTVNIAAPA
jgi:hypothetical protein